MGAATSTARSASSPPPFKQSFVRLTGLQAFDVLAFTDVRGIAPRSQAPLDAATIERLAAVDGAGFAAVGFQRIVRGRIAQNFFDRVRTAQQAGVMLAFRDAVQAQSGWYLDFDFIQYHFAVERVPNDGNRWWQVVTNAELARHRNELESCDVLVAREGTACGESGAYFELPAGTSRVSRRTTSSDWEVGSFWRRRGSKAPEDAEEDAGPLE